MYICPGGGGGADDGAWGTKCGDPLPGKRSPELRGEGVWLLPGRPSESLAPESYDCRDGGVFVLLL